MVSVTLELHQTALESSPTLPETPVSCAGFPVCVEPYIRVQDVC